MAVHNVTFWYKVYVPDDDNPTGKELRERIVAEIHEEDPEYWSDPENNEPQVVEAAIAYHLIAQFQVGNYTDLVEVLDDQID